MDLGKKIKELRILKELTQNDIAKHLGMEQSNYSRLEQKGDKITFEQIRKIAGFFEISILELLGFGDDANSFLNLQLDILRRENELLKREKELLIGEKNLIKNENDDLIIDNQVLKKIIRGEIKLEDMAGLDDLSKSFKIARMIENLASIKL